MIRQMCYNKNKHLLDLLAYSTGVSQLTEDEQQYFTLYTQHGYQYSIFPIPSKAPDMTDSITIVDMTKVLKDHCNDDKVAANGH